MVRLRKMLCGVAVIVLAAIGIVRGQDAPATAPSDAPPAESPAESPAAPKPFPKGMEDFTITINYQNERRGANISLSSVALGWDKYAIDNGVLGYQVLGYYTHDDEDGLAIGFNAYGRYHVLNFDRFSIYGDILGGVFVGTEDFPTGGTALNFTYAGGPGLMYRINDNTHIMGGMRFQHVSNLFIEGRDRNPIFNSFGGYVGLMWER